MKPQIIGRIISVLILAVLFGLYLHHTHVTTGEMGRDAFLSKQAARFDKFFAHPPALPIEVVGSIIFFGILFGLYEVVALGFSKIFEKASSGEGR